MSPRRRRRRAWACRLYISALRLASSSTPPVLQCQAGPMSQGGGESTSRRHVASPEGVEVAQERQ